MKVLGISGTITGSKTLIVLNRIMENLKEAIPEIEVELLDLKQYNVQFCDGRSSKEYTGDTKKVIELVSSADCYVIGTPIFQGSFTGALKNLIDLIPPSIFNEKIMGFVGTGSSSQHCLVIENQLKPIASYLNSYIVPKVVFAHNEQFNANNEIHDPELSIMIENFTSQYEFLINRLGKTSGVL